MILIISSQDDLSTHEVVDWLLYYKQPFLRISQDDNIEIQRITISNERHVVHFKVRGVTYCSQNFTSIWYRRGWITTDLSEYTKKSQSPLKVSLNNQFFGEKTTSFNYLYFLLFKDSINKPSDCNLNKLITLQLASEIGLRIPHSEILSTKKEVQILNRKYNLINKPVTQGVFINSAKEMVNTLTTEVTAKNIKGIPDTFFPTLFQEKINKEIELRAFFIEEQFFTSAIFSQQDPKTSTDFRNYNEKHPNRTPPFILPSKIQQQLVKLMNKLGLNSGSIDIILSKKGEYVFLEVNPIGQFKQVSYPCNYYIEHFIAKKLIAKNENNKIQKKIIA